MRLTIAMTCSLLALGATSALAQQPGSKSPPPPQAQPHPQAAAPTATATLKDASGKPVGTVTLRQAAHGVLLTGSLSGLPPGEHAFHVHEVGLCEPPFKSAGAHFNPSGHEHGIDNPKGMHAGDLPNIYVSPSGEAKFDDFLLRDVSLLPGTKGSLFDKDGSSIIIHAAPDDYRSNPAGNAGDRIACGVIEKR